MSPSTLMARAESFTDDGLFFDFGIWNGGDGNCCPSAGTVHGTYKCERQANGHLLISMDTFKRVNKTDWN
jgi:hypothetical protein